MRSGSLPYLFGLQHIQRADHTLLFVEGELNAISVAQCIPRGVAVVSAGSDSNGNAIILHALAARFDRTVIWMDNPIKAVTMRNRMGRDAQLIQSPVKNDHKWDANEMLRAGFWLIPHSAVVGGLSGCTSANSRHACIMGSDQPL